MRATLVALAAVLALTTAALGAAPPQAGIKSFAELTPPSVPYDESADANAAVKAAFLRAKKNHKRVLIDLGGNWCGDCRILAGVMDLPDVRTFVDRHYEVVSVDVGRFNKNLQIPARFGFTKRLLGVPTVLIVSPRGHVVNANDVFALSDARHMAPQAVVDWLAKYAL